MDGKLTFMPPSAERKLGFFVQIKKGDNFNRRNTLSISRIKIWVWRPAEAGGEKDSFRSDTT